MKYLLITLQILVSSYLIAQVETEDVIHHDSSMEAAKDSFVEQVINPNIRIISTMTDEGMRLRWAPTTKEIWYDGIDHGYILEKLILDGDTTSSAFYTTLGNGPIKPWTEQKWKSIPFENKPYYLAASQCLSSQRQDDGAGFVTAFENQQNIFGIQLLAADLDWEAALASGLGYLDTSVKKGEEEIYIYRIHLHQATNSNFQDTTSRLTTTSIKDHLPPIIREVKESEDRITLEWEDSDAQSSGYFVERSIDGIQFTRINKLPYIDITTNVNPIKDQVVFIDTLVEEQVNYQYRVIGIDAFARESAPSEIVTASTKDVTPPTPPYNTTVQEMDDLAVITWDWKDDVEANDLAGFMILRAQNDEVFDTLTTNLLPVTELKFMDTNPDQVATNFYKVLAVDKAGNSSASDLAFLITSDDTPPAAPTNLSADIDTTGGLLLTWTPPADEDVRGYLVHFSNSLNSDFAVVAGEYLPDSFYVEQLNLNTLTESIYYYVVALDLSYNPSIASEIIEVKKPDIIPPAPSIFTDYKVSEEGIYFEWASSKSKDLVEVILERKEKTALWKIVEDFDKTIDHYLDQNVKGGILYEYRLVSIDDDGNKTYSTRPLALEALTPFFIPSVTDINLTDDDEQIALSWNYENIEDYQFIIYRKTSDGKFKTLKKISGINSFIDTKSEKNKSYAYAVKAIAKDGRESKLSDIVSID